MFKQISKIFFPSAFRFSLMLFLSHGVLLVGCQNNSDNGKLDATDVEFPVTADSKSDAKVMPIMEFDKKMHDFGNIKAGEKVSYSFRFVNRGRRNLIIQNASGSCGCTVPDFPKQPIPPGREGFIRVLFNSEGKNGVQEKQVTVLANTLPNTNEIRIKANIIP